MRFGSKAVVKYNSMAYSIDHLLKELNDTRQQTLAYFALPPKTWTKQYAPGKWNVRQLLHHIVDADTVLYKRVRRVIAEPEPHVLAFDQDRWCEQLDYEQIPLSVNQAIYAATRPAVIHLAERFYESLYDKPFVHSETGPRTLGQEFEKIAWHNAHHLQQIAEALKR